MTQPRSTPYCSFCGKPAAEVRQIIAGAWVYICDECVATCSDILADEHESTDPSAEDWREASDERLRQQLPRVAATAAQIGKALHARVAELRRRDVTWARIREALGMTQQSAWERFCRTEQGTHRRASPRRLSTLSRCALLRDRGTRLQLELTPDHLLGRVGTAFNVLIWGGRPVGAAAAGALLEVFTPGSAFWMFATWVIVLLVIAFLGRGLRGLGRDAEPTAVDQPVGERDCIGKVTSRSSEADG